MAYRVTKNSQSRCKTELTRFVEESVNQHLFLGWLYSTMEFEAEGEAT